MILAVKIPRDCHDVNKTNFKYTPGDCQVMEKLRLTKEAPCRAMETEDGNLVLPQKEGREYVNLHYLTHLGTKKN